MTDWFTFTPLERLAYLKQQSSVIQGKNLESKFGKRYQKRPSRLDYISKMLIII